MPAQPFSFSDERGGRREIQIADCQACFSRRPRLRRVRSRQSHRMPVLISTERFRETPLSS
jgi:hypothetical protein